MSQRRILAIFSLSLFIGVVSILWHLSTSTSEILKSAALSPKPMMSRPSVIIVGSGLAGLSAASELIARGVEVKLLERASKPGGNSMKASSGINGAPTRWQPGPPLSDTFFYDDTLKSVGEVLSTAKKQRESLVATLTNSSSDAVDWLVDEKGVDLSVVAQLGGHSFPRTHRGAGKTPPGAAIVTTLLTKLKESGKFELSTHCVVTKILKPGHVVEGVEYESHGEKRVLEGPVIFTTGGFAGDAHGLLAKYRPDLAGFPSTNEARPGSQPLLTEVGAGLLDMKEVQIHPTSFVDPKDILNPVKFLAAEVLRGEGGLLLYNGKRFVNEMETRKNVTGAFLKLPIADPDPKQFDVQLVVDEGVYRSSSSHIDFYVWKGLMKRMTLTELGTQAIEAVREYSFVAEGKKQDPFGRQSFGHWELKPEDVGEGTVVYVGRVTPAVHFTMGGVTINDKSQVLDEQGNAVNGLWAAGEVTGGVHGQNRLGGSSLLECVVFGRTAGREAAKFVGI